MLRNSYSHSGLRGVRTRAIGFEGGSVGACEEEEQEWMVGGRNSGGCMG